MFCYRIAILVLLVTYSGIVLADQSISRIHKTQKNSEVVDQIHMTPGLVTLVEFNRPITEVRVGDASTVKALLSKVSPKELTLILTQKSIRPTNVIVRTETKVLVFDVVPSVTKHQDYIKISSSYADAGFLEKSVILSPGSSSVQPSKNIVSENIAIE